jgi:hypothetical protein
MYFSLKQVKIQLSEFTIKYAKTGKFCLLRGRFLPYFRTKKQQSIYILVARVQLYRTT